MAPSDSEIFIEEASYAVIEPVWRHELWPGREDVRPTSSMTLDGKYDLSLHQNPRWFFCARNGDGEIVGVNSLLKTGPEESRSRGLYVRPTFRKRGVARALLRFSLERAREMEHTAVWTYPRASAWRVYQSVGFVARGSWTEDGHCYAINRLHESQGNA